MTLKGISLDLTFLPVDDFHPQSALIHPQLLGQLTELVIPAENSCGQTGCGGEIRPTCLDTVRQAELHDGFEPAAFFLLFCWRKADHQYFSGRYLMFDLIGKFIPLR